MKHWEVNISVDGNEILTISSQHLSGIDNVSDYDAEIKVAAESLLGFIGEPLENPTKRSKRWKLKSQSPCG
jgi:hypothetical protein